MIGILNDIGVPAEVVPASERMLAGSQRAGHLWSLPGSAAGLIAWARRLARHEVFDDADAIYTVAFKAHLAVAWLRRHPVVWHLHEYPPTVTSMLWRLTSRFVPDAMIANSNATAEAWGGRATYHVQRATEVGGGRLTSHVSPLTVVPNGVDLDRFRPDLDGRPWRRALGLAEDIPLIGLLGGLRVMKGHAVAVAAAARLAAEGRDFQLAFVGQGAMEPAIRAAVAQAGLGERVSFRGDEPSPESVVAAFDVALYVPMESDGMSRVLFEYLAAGKPVVASRVGVVPEVLSDGSTALLVPAGEPLPLKAMPVIVVVAPHPLL